MADAGRLALADGSHVVCTATLRELPGKRAVFAGRRDGQEVIVKQYLDPRRGAVHARREAAGLAAFARAGIAAPPVLYDGSDDEGHALLVLQRIAAAATFGEVFHAATVAERRTLLTQMMRLLAQHHAAGVCQADLHPNNFLLADGRLYSIDGAAVDAREEALGEDAALANVALFCAQFTPDNDALCLDAAPAYLAARGWSDTLMGRLPAAISAARDRRWCKLLPKLFRECTAVQHRVRGRREAYVMRDAGPALAALADDPDASCPSEPAARLKNGNTATVWRTEVDGAGVVVKRYNVKNPWHGLQMWFKHSRAAISWRNAHMLDLYGIATPAPLALVVERRGLFGRRAWFISREVAGMPLNAWVDARGGDPGTIAAMAAQVGHVLAALRVQRISHGDMKATNFLVVDDRLYLIDLDAMQRHHNLSRFEHAWRRDLQRFMANWHDRPDVAAAMRDAIRVH